MIHPIKDFRALDASTPNKPNKKFKVSVEDAISVNRFKWHVHKGYVSRTAPRPDKRLLLLHRVIANAKQGQIVDHINGDTMDNRRENLRIATRSQNGMNRKPNKGRKFKGVFKHKKSGFDARIGAGNDSFYLGHYKTKEEASIAYDVAANILHGEYAKPNKFVNKKLQTIINPEGF